MNKLPELIKLIHIAHDEDALRAEKNKRPLCKEGSANGGGGFYFYDTKLKELKKERQQILKSLPLKSLAGEEKEIFSLRFIKGKAVRAIAKKMHYSPSTIHHKIARICDKLHSNKHILPKHAR